MASGFRFGVGSPQGPRSRTWGLRRRKGDVYVYQRRAGYACKLSLHESGARNFSYVDNATAREATAHLPDLDSRHMLALGPAPELYTGHFMAAQILVPGSELIDRPYSGDRRIRWTPISDRRSAVEFSFLTTGPGIEHARAPEELNAEAIYKAPLPDGRMLWVAVRSDAMLEGFEEQLEILKGRFPIPENSQGGIMAMNYREDLSWPLLIEIGPCGRP